jgi:hypothetical protein
MPMTTTFKDKFAKRKVAFPDEGIVGQESPWLPIGELDVTGESLCAVDVTMFNADDGVTVKVPSGSYIVEGKAMDFDGHLRVSRIRAYPKGTEPMLGEVIGETDTDSGMIAICDIHGIDARLTDEDYEALSDRLFDVSIKGGDVITIDLGSKRVTFAASESGWGDGGYPTHALLNETRTVGIEVEFLPTESSPGEGTDGSDGE